MIIQQLMEPSMAGCPSSSCCLAVWCRLAPQTGSLVQVQVRAK